MSKVTLDLPILLPEIPDERDRCVDRLLTALQVESGIDQAHLKEGAPPQVCIHYDRDQVALERVKAIARRAGAEITERYRHVLLDVTGIRHQRHARQTGERIAKADGIMEAVVSGAGVVRIEYDSEVIDEDSVRAAVEATDLTIKDVVDEHAGHDHPPGQHGRETHAAGDGHNHDHGGVFGENTELYFAILSGVFWLAGLLLSFLGGVAEIVPTVLYVIAILLGGYFILIEAVQTIRQGKFEIDFLMLVAAAGACALGAFQEAALLLFLFSIGHALENYAMGKARKSIAALSDLAPPTALVKRGGDTVEVGVGELQVGDTIVVRPNSKIAADGVIVSGTSAVDQAPITGESVPVDKRPVDDIGKDYDLNTLAAEHRAFAGTINGSSPLEIRVMKLAGDSTLSRLVTLVKEAETQQSPTQQLTDKFERYFVPAVIGLVVLLLFAFLVIDEPFSASFYRAMAVLVAASPCALAISTPSAVLAGVARAARQGVLIKGGRPLEDLGGITALAFDKTGTLTEGKPRLTQVIPATGVREEDLLSTAVAVEELSDHPLAAAIVEGGKEKLQTTTLPKAENLEALTARGIKATVEGQQVHIGNRRLFRELTGAEVPQKIDRQMAELETKGNTAMIVHRDGKYLGVIAVMDVARPEAKATLAALKEVGIKKMVMLTGDHQKVADAVAADIGITDPLGSLLPEDKVTAIERLRAEEGMVAMIGDGVNDAPAMAKSTVGIAMGAAGSDVALETADIALMADRLDNLPFAIGLSRKAKSIIRQNLVLSLGMVVILIPLTLLGIADIGPAVIAHEGSTLVVVGNALRLLAYGNTKK
ncbi:Potassium-transporting ATPase ATP-binding subunit [Neolewinella maritima]|uniref:P-type Zn(2+) transporter n=1 Tax=Neolewinella maritima TaxID=1383882 RepID=A0ABN8F6L6_9BACT|nr:heavy metal translocating P-type ATPase [Neolewinella maritima]CAH1002568.1 Potassium-transporting ATPase ATP-binding subunit [Neolewinella maritima]